jgi:Protein of unknown function (DUF1697)
MACLEQLGCENVRTYIASGNVMFESNKSSAELAEEIQETLPKKFKLDSELIRILVPSHDQVQKVIDQAPKGIGTEPGKTTPMPSECHGTLKRLASSDAMTAPLLAAGAGMRRAARCRTLARPPDGCRSWCGAVE